MGISVYDTIQEGRLQREQLAQTQQRTREGDMAYADALYETNPQAGMDYAKKIGLLPPGAMLTSVSVNGVETPAASIPGLAKPIILPSPARTSQRASAAAQTLALQQDEARAARDTAREVARNARLTYTMKTKRETDLLIEKVKQAGRMTEQLRRAEDELNLAREKAALDFTSDEAQRAYDLAKQQYEYMLKSALETQEQAGRMEVVDKQTQTQKDITGMEIGSREKISGQEQSTKVFMQDRDITEKKRFQAEDNAAKSMRQVREGEQKENQIKLQGEVTKGVNAEKPARGGSQRLSAQPVTPEQTSATWRNLAPVMDEMDQYSGAWKDAPQHLKNSTAAIAEVTNLMAGAYKKAGKVKSQTQITQELAKELRNPNSNLWILDADSGEKTINISALEEYAQRQIDTVTYANDVARVRELKPNDVRGMTDADIARMIAESRNRKE